MISTWRDTARLIIAEVIRNHPEASTKELKVLIREAYPFGARKWHPYKIWCDEVNTQLGIKKKKDKRKLK